VTTESKHSPSFTPNEIISWVRRHLGAVTERIVRQEMTRQGDAEFLADRLRDSAHYLAERDALLAACKAALAGIDQMGSDWSDETGQVLRDAIAKAEASGA